jgi:hypothetical protein
MLPMIFGQIVRVKNDELNHSLFGNGSMETDPWRVKQTENMAFNRCLPARKARGPRGPRIHCPRTESNLVLYEAEFRLDLMVGFVAKNLITNHEEVDHGRLKLMSAINWF